MIYIHIYLLFIFIFRSHCLIFFSPVCQLQFSLNHRFFDIEKHGSKQISNLTPQEVKPFLYHIRIQSITRFKDFCVARQIGQIHPQKMTYLCLSTYCIDDISCSSQYIIEKVQIQCFSDYKISFFFDILIKHLSQKLIPVFFLFPFVAYLILHRIIYWTLFQNVLKLRKADLKIDHSHHILPILIIISYSSLGIFPS